MARLLAIALLLALPAAAQSRRVVVMHFGGPQSPTVRAQVIANLMEQPGIEVVPDDEIDAARDRLHLSGRMSPEDYVQLARELRATAFIDGIVSRRPRHWAATVRVRNAADGAELGNESWGGRTAAALSGVRRSFSRLQPYIARASVPGAAPSGGPTPWYQQHQAQPQQEEEPIVDENERPPGLSPPGGEPEPEPGPTAPPPPSHRADRYESIRVSLTSPGILYRWMEATASVYAAQRRMAPADPSMAFLDERRSYSGPSFEPGIFAEVYPGALDDRQTFPYVGLILSYQQSLFVQSVGRDPNSGERVPVSTDQREAFIGARGRYSIAVGPRHLEPFLDLGYGLFEFLLGTDALQHIERDTVVAPFSLGYVQIAGGARFEVVPTYLTLGLDLGYRIGAALGADTRNVWGTTTSPGGGFLFGLEARTQVPLGEDFGGGSIFFALRLMYFQFTTVYRGQVGCAVANACNTFMNPWEDQRLWEPWPVNPTTPTDLNRVVGGIHDGVNDNYIRIQAQVGWAWR